MRPFVIALLTLALAMTGACQEAPPLVDHLALARAEAERVQTLHPGARLSHPAYEKVAQELSLVPAGSTDAHEARTWLKEIQAARREKLFAAPTLPPETPRPIKKKKRRLARRTVPAAAEGDEAGSTTTDFTGDWIDQLNNKAAPKKAAPSRGGGSTHRVNVRITYHIEVPGQTWWTQLKVPVPKDQLDRQAIKVAFSPQPSRTWEKGHNRYAEFTFDPPQKSFDVVMDLDATLYGYDLRAAEGRSSPSTLKGPGYQEYYRHEPKIQRDSPLIQSIAKGLPGTGDFNDPDELGTVEAIFDYVSGHLRYERQPKRHGAEAAAKQRFGDCSEFTDLFVALCRAKNIPARAVAGILVEEDNSFHAWAEVYLKQYGWVPFDPTFANGRGEGGKRWVFRNLDPFYLYVTIVHYGDPVVEGGEEWIFYKGDPVTIRRNVEILP